MTKKRNRNQELIEILKEEAEKLRVELNASLAERDKLAAELKAVREGHEHFFEIMEDGFNKQSADLRKIDRSIKWKSIFCRSCGDVREVPAADYRPRLST